MDYVCTDATNFACVHFLDFSKGKNKLKMNVNKLFAKLKVGKTKDVNEYGLYNEPNQMAKKD